MMMIIIIMIIIMMMMSDFQHHYLHPWSKQSCYLSFQKGPMGDLLKHPKICNLLKMWIFSIYLTGPNI